MFLAGFLILETLFVTKFIVGGPVSSISSILFNRNNPKIVVKGHIKKGYESVRDMFI